MLHEDEGGQGAAAMAPSPMMNPLSQAYVVPPSVVSSTKDARQTPRRTVPR